MRRTTSWFLLLFLVFPAYSTGQAADSVVFKAMEEEMARSSRDLKIDVFSPPYFTNYQIRHQEIINVVGSFGALVDSKSEQHWTLYVDVKVGDPQFDSSSSDSHQVTVEQRLPLDEDIDTLKRAIWYETDLRYKQAIMNYLKKKGRYISGGEKHDHPDFIKSSEARVRVESVPELHINVPQWEALVRKVSAGFKSVPEIEKSEVKIFGTRLVRYYLDSEGNKIRDAVIYYGVLLEAWTKTDTGNPIHDQESFYFSNLEGFPSEKVLMERTQQLIAGVKALRKASEGQPYVGPAIFSPDATAVLFHEAVGHRLEADRLRMVADGKTFLEKIGEQILPSFITLVDNPTMKSFNGEDLLGSYQFDDEGQRSEEVVLVGNGTLRSFLMSRTPILGFARTNGHARGDGLRTPMSRMGNFIVKSGNEVSTERLKELLLQEVARQNKPYGLLIKKISGGETHTDSFQVFKGKPLYLYRVYPDGREELVRGVEFVGTPLSMIGKILVTGNDYAVINGFCGAESGSLPVTSIAPSILLQEVELQTSHEQILRRPILPPPELAR